MPIVLISLFLLWHAMAAELPQIPPVIPQPPAPSLHVFMKPKSYNKLVKGRFYILLFTSFLLTQMDISNLRIAIGTSTYVTGFLTIFFCPRICFTSTNAFIMFTRLCSTGIPATTFDHIIPKIPYIPRRNHITPPTLPFYHLSNM